MARQLMRGLVVVVLLAVGYALTAEYNACRYEGSL